MSSEKETDGMVCTGETLIFRDTAFFLAHTKHPAMTSETAAVALSRKNGVSNNEAMS